MRDGTIRNNRMEAYKESAIDKYESMLRVHAMPAIGGLRMCDLTVSVLAEFIDLLAAEESPETAKKTRDAISVCFRRAIREDLVAANPCREVRAPATANGRPSRILDLDEQAALGSAAQQVDARLGHSRAFPILRLALDLGLRSGEILAAQWGPHSLDLHQGTFTVGRFGNLARKRDRATGKFPMIAPKSSASLRTMEMPPSLVQAMERHRSAVGEPDDGALVFADGLGNPVCAVNVLNRDWQRTLDSAGLASPRPRFHDLRHTWAVTMLRALGVERVQVVRELGGWSSTKMVWDRYGRHALPSERLGTGAALDNYRSSHVDTSRNGPGMAP
ncbi:MAG: tyrosine-type recombinase/integrase [Thermoleophilia bacterium]